MNRDDNVKDYHDTTPQDSQRVPQLTDRARSQNERVLQYLRMIHPEVRDAEQIMVRLQIASRTSMSRALSTLLKRGLVEKGRRRMSSRSGVKILTWRAVVKGAQGDLF